MAAKLRILKMLHEIRGFALVTNRQPPARSPALVTTPLRSQVLQAALPRRRLSIRTAGEDLPEAARPVRIVHVKPDSSAGLRLPAP